MLSLRHSTHEYVYEKWYFDYSSREKKKYYVTCELLLLEIDQSMHQLVIIN